MLFANKKANLKDEVVELDALKLNASIAKPTKSFRQTSHHARIPQLRHLCCKIMDSRNKVCSQTINISCKGLVDTKSQISFSQKTTVSSSEQPSPLDFYHNKRIIVCKTQLHNTRSKIMQPHKCKGDNPIQESPHI